MGTKASGRKLPINLFDIIIIILVVIIAGVLIFMRIGGGNDDSQASVNAGQVEYQVEITNLATDPTDVIKAGDNIVDKIKKYNIGAVKDVEIYPMTKEATDYDTGATVYTEIPGYYSACITIVADCTDSESAFIVDGGFEVRTGTEMSIVGPGYSGAGYIVGVTRGDI